MTLRQKISESVVGAIDWQNSDFGYCRCPGSDLHTNQDGKRDCRVTLDQVPTIYCFHTSCAGPVETANHRLRSEIGRAERSGISPTCGRREMTEEERRAIAEKHKAEDLKLHAQKSLAVILKQNAMEPADLWALSPYALNDDPRNDWRLLLSLFHPDDIVWIGGKFSSCNDDANPSRKHDCEHFFRPVKDWLLERQAPGQFTCPCTFKPGTHSRSNANVVRRRFLVIESDELAKPEMCAIIVWCRRFLRLRAVVDTAGKSLHGWFDAPPAIVEKELRLILPALKTDPALFKLSQPCRLPGALRDGRYQTLYYLAP